MMKIPVEVCIDMANCPNCGSDHIQLKRDTNVSWGRAVAGWALFGVVGGAVGAVTGEDRNANTCLNCGTSWKAADLYKTLQIIKNLTSERLDLSRDEDRNYMNSFMVEISPSLDALSDVEKKYEKLIADKEKELTQGAGTGCGYGCGLWLLCLFSAGSLLGGGGLPLTFILFPLIGWGIGESSDKANKKRNERAIEDTKREAARKKAEATKTIKLKVEEFMENY